MSEKKYKLKASRRNKDYPVSRQNPITVTVEDENGDGYLVAEVEPHHVDGQVHREKGLALLGKLLENLNEEI